MAWPNDKSTLFSDYMESLAMCGIFGALSDQPVADTLVTGLSRLEYRGYDSAGIATIESGRLQRLCAVGKVEALAKAVSDTAPTGTIGIAHTRWATHGAPCERNSHPHMAPGVAVVHNGIIENHACLRSDLQTKGCAFKSETDTETIPWLVSRNLDRGMSPDKALRAAAGKLEGAYAVGMMSERHPERIFTVKKASPLVAAVGANGSYLSSDPNALAGLAREAVCLEDGDQIELLRDRLIIRDSSGRTANRQTVPIAADIRTLGKGGFEHYMRKEIDEQPLIAAAIAEFYDRAGAYAAFDRIDLAKLERLSIIACGTSYYAALVAKRWFEAFAGLPTDVQIASEHRYAPQVPHRGRAASLFISQSGETADTLASFEREQAAGTTTIAVVNEVASTLGREAGICLPILAGQEIGVASTKAFTAQLLVLGWLALHLAEKRGIAGIDVERERSALRGVGHLMQQAMQCEGQLSEIAREELTATSSLFVARGPLYPLALEGALKLKEISYIHAEGFPAGELKHGPIALVDEFMPIVALANSGDFLTKMKSNLQEIAARKGRIILIGDTQATAQVQDIVKRTVTIPQSPEIIEPVIAAIPLQLLAYHAANSRGLDVDRPRNLAKSVTVE